MIREFAEFAVDEWWDTPSTLGRTRDLKGNGNAFLLKTTRGDCFIYISSGFGDEFFIANIRMTIRDIRVKLVSEGIPAVPYAGLKEMLRNRNWVFEGNITDTELTKLRLYW